MQEEVKREQDEGEEREKEEEAGARVGPCFSLL